VCGESIVASARMCRFCRTRFDQPSEAPADG
jgi:hypothetical protein